MAEIIKVGYMKVPEYELVCKHCGTLAKYQKRELKFFDGCYDEDLVEFRCPYCDEYNSFFEDDLPKPCNMEEKEMQETIKENKKEEKLKKIKYKRWRSFFNF